MDEFRIGIFNLLKKIIGGSSITLAIIYTLGHILIAMTSNYLITGARLDLAVADALIEPIVNGFWFYALHKIWKGFQD
jgi:uncharacterized membrane protein